MRAVWYERQGVAKDVLTVGEMPTPAPGPGEVRIRIAVSGINPGDIKKRQDAFGYGMAYRRVIPHSDGAGQVDQVGEGVSPEWLGRRVWCYGAQSYRPFGTAAEYTVVPLAQVVSMPESMSMEQGACLGIPGITGYQAVHAAGTSSCDALSVLGIGRKARFLKIVRRWLFVRNYRNLYFRALNQVGSRKSSMLVGQAVPTD